MNWTEEQRHELMRLYRQGLTSYQMAEHFGVSRNAICGRIHRERVSLGEIESKPRIRKPQRRKQMLTLPARAEFGVSAYIQSDPQKPSEGFLASIVDVTGCRWPVKDDPAFIGGVAFCNHATDGKTYCPYHTQVSTASFSRNMIRKTIKQALFVYEKKDAA